MGDTSALPCMKPFLAKTVAALLLFTTGVAAGCFLSDIAAVSGFPQARYLVTLKHEISAEADYVCTRTGAALGDNFSEFDKSLGKQTNCVLGLTGQVLPDGAFLAHTAPFQWSGRLGITPPFRIEAARIQRIRPL